MLKTVYSGEKRTAVRVSKYESIETALKLSNLASWIWLDYFGIFPLKTFEFEKLKNAKFKICLVSPELQGFSYLETKKFILEIYNKSLIFDGVDGNFYFQGNLIERELGILKIYKGEALQIN